MVITIDCSLLGNFREPGFLHLSGNSNINGNHGIIIIIITIIIIIIIIMNSISDNIHNNISNLGNFR